MPKAKLPSGIELEYDSFGDKSAPALILVMGLGAQMIAWRDEWCELLAAQGFCVVRFDNRDVGLSTHLDHLPVPRAKHFLQVVLFKKRGLADYYLKDMAEDVVALMDCLEIQQAHICGASMGGMIAQEIGIHFPERVLSLCLIMTSPGDRRLPKPRLKVILSALTQPSPKNVEKSIKHRARHLGIIGSVNELAPTFKELLEHASHAHERSPYRRGTLRQSFAVFNSPNRTKALKKLDVPTLIIHGDADPLVTKEHGVALKAAMPHAQIELIENMGHDIPSPLYQGLSKMISDFSHGKDKG